jgi:hypothetical protein
MYEITNHSKTQAKKLGVEIKPSTNKNKKIDVNQGLSNGLITTGTYKVSGSNLTFELEKSSGPTEWKINKSEKTISRDRVSLRFVQEIE